MRQGAQVAALLVVVARDCDAEVASRCVVGSGAKAPSRCRALVRDIEALAMDERRGGGHRESPLLFVVASDCDAEVASRWIVVFGAAVPSGCRALVRDFGVLAPNGRRGGEDRESPLLFVVASR